MLNLIAACLQPFPGAMEEEEVRVSSNGEIFGESTV